ncbi:hypothetical protein MIMGU_mgv1a017752mg [Erythranthe guttata]|uniref:F-box domain-containing protein n=1 Tax=Erythranthe guttata TaxID=4155 RepID=A0A022QJW3_ERYGU|nr:hypothetical protein MIMGU_mgv1a017752mg [Erythranthe guttata]
MKRPKGKDGFNSTCRISILPEHILQKILYFLSQKEAVRTSVLSKSWRSIWCTRPNLDFSIQAFEGNKQDFITTVDNTLQRYLDHRLCIEEFSLRVSIGGDDDEESMPALEQWITLVTSMGLKELRLRNSTEDYKINHLPSVVFEAESLKYLHLDRFIVDQTTIRRILLLKNLKSLDLQRVSIKDDIFEKIILSSPMIETLAVRNCRTLTTIDAMSLQNLKKFTFVNDNVPFVDDCRIKIHTPSLQVIDFRGRYIPFLMGADFRNLTRLSLTDVVSPLDHLSTCKFPILEILIIFDCCGFEEIKLFIDAPKINSFDYFGDFIPSISFATTSSSSEWHSTIHLHSIDVFSSLWFVNLNELLKSLSQSIISLNIDQCSPIRENIMVQDKNIKPVVVDSLGLRFDLSSISSLMNALFCLQHILLLAAAAMHPSPAMFAPSDAALSANASPRRSISSKLLPQHDSAASQTKSASPARLFRRRCFCCCSSWNRERICSSWNWERICSSWN